jgi:hypothetical protein
LAEETVRPGQSHNSVKLSPVGEAIAGGSQAPRQFTGKRTTEGVAEPPGERLGKIEEGRGGKCEGREVKEGEGNREPEQIPTTLQR